MQEAGLWTEALQEVVGEVLVVRPGFVAMHEDPGFFAQLFASPSLQVFGGDGSFLLELERVADDGASKRDESLADGDESQLVEEWSQGVARPVICCRWKKRELDEGVDSALGDTQVGNGQSASSAETGDATPIPEGPPDRPLRKTGCQNEAAAAALLESPSLLLDSAFFPSYLGLMRQQEEAWLQAVRRCCVGGREEELRGVVQTLCRAFALRLLFEISIREAETPAAARRDQTQASAAGEAASLRQTASLLEEAKAAAKSTCGRGVFGFVVEGSEGAILRLAATGDLTTPESPLSSDRSASWVWFDTKLRRRRPL